MTVTRIERLAWKAVVYTIAMVGSVCCCALLGLTFRLMYLAGRWGWRLIP